MARWNAVLLWLPRILCLAVALFLAMLALDSSTVAEFAMHLIPSAIVLLILAASWRHEWIGAALLAAAGIFYWARVGSAHMSWVVIISGPLFLVAALFAWSWV